MPWLQSSYWWLSHTSQLPLSQKKRKAVKAAKNCFVEKKLKKLL